MSRTTPWLMALACSWLGCGHAENDATASGAGPLAVGQSRSVELRFLRFDVTNFEKRLTREDILALPDDVRERMWLLDLDLSSAPSTPQLLDNSLAAIRALDPKELSPAARNMQGLLMMTPDTANLEATALESLLDLAPLIGVAPEQVLADLLGIDVEAPFLSDAVVAQAILDGVIGSHPNTRTRLGPKTPEHPDGVYPVAAGALPVTLGDVVSDFASFGERFGAYRKDGVEHPGFVAGTTRANVLTEEFALVVRANANALPYKGLDLGDASIASVNSVRSQIDDLFDFEDPNWLRVEGLVEGVPVIESLTFRITESNKFVAGGQSPVPSGVGASLAWQLAPWTLERVLIDASQRAFATLNSTISYTPPGREGVLFEATVSDGFQEVDVQGGLGSPPPPSYVWDLLLETAQVRLHDGGLREGEADVEFSLRNVPIGTDTETLADQIRDNLRQNPHGLLDVAETLIDTTEGAADFYFYRADATNTLNLQGDWLFFVTDDDLDENERGQPTRGYAYAHPGFYSDAALTQKVSHTLPLDGDSSHEKVRLDEHPVVYVEDDEGAVYELAAGEKPSPNRRVLTVTRVR